MTTNKIQAALGFVEDMESGCGCFIDDIIPYKETIREVLQDALNPWKPIDTAPDDGRYFITWCEQIGCQQNNIRPEVTRIKDGMYEGLMFFDEPTHWMPLPPNPPEKTND